LTKNQFKIKQVDCERKNKQRLKEKKETICNCYWEHKENKSLKNR